jgi:excisionase family DNA binding protein
MQNLIESSGTDRVIAQDPIDENAVLTADEVARELRCSKAHVYNAIKGKVSGISALRVIRMGRRILIRRSSLHQWLRENERADK